jgi:hypothetical protein
LSWCTFVVDAILFEALFFDFPPKICAGSIFVILLLFAFDFWWGDHRGSLLCIHHTIIYANVIAMRIAVIEYSGTINSRAGIMDTYPLDPQDHDAHMKGYTL